MPLESRRGISGLVALIPFVIAVFALSRQRRYANGRVLGIRCLNFADAQFAAVRLDLIMNDATNIRFFAAFTWSSAFR